MADQKEEKYLTPEEYRAQGGAIQGHKVTVSTHTIGAVIIVVVLCALSFAGGLQYQKHHGSSKTVATTAQNGFARGMGGNFGGRQGRMGEIGSVTAITDTSITIQNQRTNDSATYAITADTTITDNGTAAKATDITTSDTVLITTSPSDSKTATRILVNPSFGGGQGGPASSDPAQTN